MIRSNIFFSFLFVSYHVPPINRTWGTKQDNNFLSHHSMGASATHGDIRFSNRLGIDVSDEADYLPLFETGCQAAQLIPKFAFCYFVSFICWRITHNHDQISASLSCKLYISHSCTNSKLLNYALCRSVGCRF